jgi:DNA (cytosine-5)-methyltransferase 1
MRSLDLFSGIGGLATALGPYAQPVLYCEIDPFCMRVLHTQMLAGGLPHAPVHSDVRTLHAAILHPSLVVAGFPCQDVSSLGARVGMAGRRSSLFFEVARLLDETPSVVAVFLENVSNIATCGGNDVVRELASRGFDMRWTMCAASDAGAPHVRLRWFLLACRGDGAQRVCDAVGGADPSAYEPWPDEPVDALLLRDEQGPNWVRRMSALGNAVVPCVARHAFATLARSAPAWRACASMLVGTALAPELPRSALVVDGVVYALPHVVAARSARYPTPRSANVYPTTHSDARPDTLSTALVRGSALAARSPHLSYLPDPAYVEWMMGFARGWTVVREVETAQPTPHAVHPRRRTLNGMHMFMRDVPGTISATSALWRALPAERRAAYSAAARME